MASFADFSRNFTRDIDRAIDESFDTNYLNQIGSQITDQIRIRTRAGFGVKSNGARQQRLRRLSPNYVETRRFARSIGLLSDATSPRRSNLTFSGNMLDSIIHTVSNRNINFAFSNKRAEEVAEEVQTRGRPFFNLSGPEINKLTRQFNNRIRTFLIRV